jgi:hypothetical protein
MLVRRLTTGLLTTAFVALWGCSSPSYEGDSLGADRDKGSADPASDDDDLEEGDDDAAGSSSKGTSPAATGPCAKEGSADACLNCCDEASPEAMPIYAGSFKSCVCETPGACATECQSSFCADIKPDSACAACLNSKAGSCEDTALSTCEKDTTCAPLLKCAKDSKCETQ